MLKELWDKIKEALTSALPVTAIVYVLALTPLFDLSKTELITFLVAVVSVVTAVAVVAVVASVSAANRAADIDPECPELYETPKPTKWSKFEMGLYDKLESVADSIRAKNYERKTAKQERKENQEISEQPVQEPVEENTDTEDTLEPKKYEKQLKLRGLKPEAAKEISGKDQLTDEHIV